MSRGVEAKKTRSPNSEETNKARVEAIFGFPMAGGGGFRRARLEWRKRGAEEVESRMEAESSRAKQRTLALGVEGPHC